MNKPFKTTHTSSRKARKQVGAYILEKAIGFGAFSTVYEGYHISTREKVAVKSINLHRINVNEKHQSNLKQEIDILRKCRHRNIVELQHTYQTSNHIYLIMQFCSGGDLHKFVLRNGKLTEIIAKKFTIQFVEGLKYLNSLKIIHRDLKPQNILLSEPSYNAILRIADFGFARYKPTGHNMVDTMCGSPLYMAPEILKFNKYDSKVDLWSAGTIIYQMVTKEPPFNGANHIELLKKIETTKRLRFPLHLSNQCKDLLIRLLKRNPLQRISWNEFFKHPWLQVLDVDVNGNKSPSSVTPRTKLRNTTPTPYEYINKKKSNSNSTKSNKKNDISPPPPPPLIINHSLSPHSNINNSNNSNPNSNNSANTPKDFVLINSENKTDSNHSSQGLTNINNITINSKIYKEFVKQCLTVFNDVSVKYEHAKNIMQVGNVQVSQDEISCALLLYLRGLDILESIISIIQKWIAKYAASTKYYHRKKKKYLNKTKNKNNKNSILMSQSKLDLFSLKYKQLLLDSIGCYTDHLKRSDAIKTLCETQHLQFDLNRVNINEVIFYYAINIAKKSASDIILNINQYKIDKNDNNNDCTNKIKQCTLLLEYLLTLDTISDVDKVVIQKYLISATKTIQVIENLQNVDNQ